MNQVKSGNSIKVRLVVATMFAVMVIVGVASHGYDAEWMQPVRSAVDEVSSFSNLIGDRSAGNAVVAETQSDMNNR